MVDETTSFYTGLANIGAGVLTGLIYLLAVMRMRSKTNIKKSSARPDEAMEPLRY